MISLKTSQLKAFVKENVSLKFVSIHIIGWVGCKFSILNENSFGKKVKNPSNIIENLYFHQHYSFSPLWIIINPRFNKERLYYKYIITIIISFHLFLNSGGILGFRLTPRTMSSSSRKFTLQSSDGSSFILEGEAALKSRMIKDMMEDDCPDEVIPVPFTGNILAKVVDYCKKHAETTLNSGDDQIKEELRSWDAEFLKVDRYTLFDLVLVNSLCFSFLFFWEIRILQNM